MISLARHLLLPHHSNNHRARLLHVDAWFFYVLFFALFNIGLQLIHKANPDVLGYATNIQVEQLLSSTNAKRQEAGLSQLSLNSQLSDAAARKAQDMFAKNYWAHNSPDGRAPWDFIKDAGYRYLVAGENLAKNFQDSSGVVDAWMNSPSHRDNLLKGNYQDVGFAIVNGVLNGEETTLVVQMFGASPVQASAPPTTQAAAPTTAPRQIAQVLPTSVPTLAPTVEATQAPTPTLLPVEVPIIALEANDQQASVAATIEPSRPVVDVGALFMGFTKAPRIDITHIKRDVMMIFIGILSGVMILDAWIVARRRVVRLSGHTMAHTLFLSMLIVVLRLIGPGTIL